MSSSHRDPAELDRITVKIHNMKRSPSRDSSSRHSLGRSSRSIGRGYDNGAGLRGGESPDRDSPERLRRRIGRSPSPRMRYAISPHRDEYARPPLPVERPHSYKVLCVSGLHPKAGDEVIKESLYREFKKFGDFNVRLAIDRNERVAYVCFRTSEDARAAHHYRPQVIIYETACIVDPVVETPRPPPEYRSRARSITPPDYEGYHYGRPPLGAGLPIEHRRPPLDPYDRYLPPHLAPHTHSREYRSSLHHHHEYLPPRGAPLHRLPHHAILHGSPLPPPHHHHQYGYMRHTSPRGVGIPAPYERLESKKDKFPNYLHHVQPEDDQLATRTLFVGNLEVTITDEELRSIFGKFGTVDDIDIKRPPPGTGNAFAFVRYQNLDMAHNAKIELSGQYIGKFQCKIGYGKASPTSRIWIGGLGGWTSVTQLEREFDRFGQIKKIEYQKGDPYAYIQYESIESATAAVKDMRGFPLGGPDRRLRTDFAELPGAPPTPIGGGYKPPKPAYDDAAIASAEYRRPEYEPYHHHSHYEEIGPPSYGHRGGYVPYMRGAYRGRGTGYRGRGRGFYTYTNEAHRAGGHSGAHSPAPQTQPAADEEDWEDAEQDNAARARSGSPAATGSRRSRSRSPLNRDNLAGSPKTESTSPARQNGSAPNPATTLTEVAQTSAVSWDGSLILKSSLFPAKFHLTDGDKDVVDSLMKDEEGKQNLRITQRLRLDPLKLEDVQKRITNSTSHAIFLGLSSADNPTMPDDNNVQLRPLRNLITYLKQKEAAGVISLLNKTNDTTGVLYAFPPCEFSTEILKRNCPNLTEETFTEDHLLIIVVRGGAT